MIGPRVRRALAAGLALLAPGAARAHLVTTGLGPFYDGVSHLAFTMEDLLPALALALLAGQGGARAGRWGLFTLTGTWLLGGLAGLGWTAAGEAPVLTAATLLLLGGLVAVAAPLRPVLLATLAAAVGLLHGALNGAAMARVGLGPTGLAGIVAALFVLVALLAGLSVSVRVPWGRVAIRVAGSWLAAIGLLSLGWALRGG